MESKPLSSSDRMHGMQQTCTGGSESQDCQSESATELHSLQLRTLRVSNFALPWQFLTTLPVDRQQSVVRATFSEQFTRKTKRPGRFLFINNFMKFIKINQSERLEVNNGRQSSLSSSFNGKVLERKIIKGRLQKKRGKT